MREQDAGDQAGLVPLGLIILYLWAPVYALPIIALWFVMGGGGVLQRLADGTADYFSSGCRYQHLLETARYRKKLGLAARRYYLTAYGGYALPAWVRWSRFGVVCAASAGMIFVDAWLSFTRTPLSQVSPPSLAVLMHIAYTSSALYGLMALSLVVQYTLSLRQTPHHSYREARRFLLSRAAAPFGGAQALRKEVWKAYGCEPKVAFQVFAPFWLDYGLYTLAVFFLLMATALAPLATHAVLEKTSQLPHTIRLIERLAVFLLTTLSAIYAVVLLWSMTPGWAAIQRGARYFPLQVLCKDLQQESWAPPL